MTERPRTAQALVAATCGAIGDVGLGATTAREITGRCGANLSAIPYYFGTKDALVAAALLDEVTELVEPVLSLLGSDAPADERATDAVVLLNDLFEQARESVPVYLAALAVAPHHPEVQAGLTALWVDLRGRLAADIAAQRDAGELPGWVEPDPMAALVLAVVQGVMAAVVVDPAGPDHQAVATQFLLLLLTARSAT